MVIEGYKIYEKVEDDAVSFTYRAAHESDGDKVLIKICKNSSDLSQLAKIRHEYEFLKKLDNDSIVRVHSLIKVDHNLALILQDTGGIPLNEIFGLNFDLKTKLTISAKIAKCLHYIHQKKILHCDIRSRNILVDPVTHNITIRNFSNATYFSNSQVVRDVAIGGDNNYPYMSPEQTGRINRPMDSRSDLYSLGVVIYELLTENLPLKASTPLEWVYAQIATAPRPLEEFVPTIPQVVSTIVLKLLAKNLEERYRSSIGLFADLELCLQKISTDGSIADFPVGKHDPSLDFRIPYKLYGREKEVELLLTTFNKVASGLSEVLLITGYSGIGKTSLVNEIYRPVIEKRGYFISGKFDQFKQNIPYSAIIQAYQDIIRQILTESEESVGIWKREILRALRQNGQVVINVIPELELIIGKQPSLAVLNAVEEENRFTLVFLEFQKTLCRAEHPIVMFIDDLQWVDSASLKLIQMLVTQTELRHLFFIGAYRENEIGQTHKLKIALDEIRRSGTVLHSLVLQPLKLQFVNRIILDTIDSNQKEIAPLGQLVFEKTQGNPFFVSQFLQSLYDQHYISFDGENMKWIWDINTIRKKNMTDNVIDLMAQKIHGLPPETQECLKLGSCIGNLFDLKTVAAVSQTSLMEMAKRLNEAVVQGLIIPSENTLSMIDSGLFTEEMNIETNISFRFLHDRIHEAAYQLCSPDERKLIHLEVGQLLLKQFKSSKTDDLIFEIVNHLNFADAPESMGERLELSALNLHAGKKAKQSSAYEPALRYFKSGLALLPQSEKWSENYQLYFDLYLNSAETLSTLSDSTEAEDFFQRLIQNAHSTFDKGVVFDKYSIFLQSSGKALEALNVTKKGLELFGITFPAAKHEIDEEMKSRIEALCRPANLKRFLELPVASSQDVLIGRLYDRCNVGTYFADPGNLPFVICKNLEHVLSYGVTPESGLAIAWFAMILGMQEKKAMSFAFADVGLKVMDRFDDPFFKGKTDMITYGQSLCWRDTFKESERKLNDAFALCHSNGELQYASYARIISYISAVAQSSDCQHVLESCQLWHDYCEKYVPLELGQAKIRVYLLKGLMGLLREEINSEEILAEYKAVNNATDQAESLAELGRIATIYGDYKDGYQYFLRAEPLIIAGAAGNLLLVMLFYHSYALCCARLYATDKEEKYLRQLNDYLDKLKVWSELNPTNFYSYYSLILAEKARALGDVDVAIQYYLETITHAQDHEYVLLQAYSNENLAELYSAQGDQKARMIYGEALYLYSLCGAKDKSEKLQKYAKISLEEIQGNRLKFSESIVTEEKSLDLVSLMKVVEIISSTIVLDDLITNVLKILIENAAAQRVVLITATNHALFVEAEANPGTTIRCESTPIELYERIPHSMINFVKRSGEVIVLGDALKQGDFFVDEYFKKEQSRSVLCMPMVRQGKLCGILYFENNLTSNVFSTQRLQVLKIISTQIAISLENARFYDELEQKVKERTDQLELERSKTAYASRLAMIGQMAGGVAHEINNPLMIIDGAANRINSVLKKPDYDVNKIKEYVAVITKTTIRVGKIVKYLLLFSGHGHDAKVVPVDISTEIAETLGLCSERMRNSGIELEYEPSSEKLETLFVPQQLRHVLISLLNNSFDAIKDISGRRWVKIEVSANGSIVTVSITDSGYLKDRAVVDKLFQPFFTTKDVGQGMGLSLSVAKGIVEEHSGQIYFDAKSEHTRFVINLSRII